MTLRSRLAIFIGKFPEVVLPYMVIIFPVKPVWRFHGRPRRLRSSHRWLTRGWHTQRFLGVHEKTSHATPVQTNYAGAVAAAGKLITHTRLSRAVVSGSSMSIWADPRVWQLPPNFQGRSTAPRGWFLAQKMVESRVGGQKIYSFWGVKRVEKGERLAR